jgi:peptide deformylase
MELVKITDPILTQPTQKFDFLSPPFEPIEFSKQIIKTLYDLKGIGLAANQIGVPYSVFAMRGDPENFVCFNPRIVDSSTETIVLEEGCLTYPNLLVKIERPRHIKVRFQTPNGDTMTRSFTGMTARIFQHELEHLQGKRFFDSLSRLKMDMAIKKANKKGSKYTYSNLKR